ncbi:MAG: hypothetical protein A2674_03735 [Candidatus Wildermuthbacteria bacterium RIFCSPHIGHO2_01_FULL_50_47]|nr:MAG: hypothetical protein A2674_03735 [Candidatus Wildermuthbacteria bacterium RIFCSPHIGHO2_01_FULL_50_47]
MACYQWFRAWSARAGDSSLFRISPFSNRWLLLATVLVVSLQMMAVYAPFMNKILRTAPLEWSDWLLAFGMGSTVLVAEELRKLLKKIRP